MSKKKIYDTFGIYRITDTVSGKSYIGKASVSFGDRWDSHRALLRSGKHFNKHLQEAWNEHGEDQIKFAIVEEVQDRSLLRDLEHKYIEEYKDKGLSYNLLGDPLSDETKQKIGEKNRINMTGRKHSAETRAKMPASQKIRAENMTEEERAKHALQSSIANRGRVRSKETKERLRKINQENPPSAKYTPDDIREIRRLRAEGYKLEELAEMYNTSSNYIWSIVTFRRWSHVQ